VTERIPVTWLAAFFHRRGDLHARLDGRTSGEEGIRAQRALQQSYKASDEARAHYIIERPVALTVTLAGRALLIGGRVDGCDTTTRPVLVEEFKTTRADHALAHRQNRDEHWAQARLYGALLAREGIGTEGFLLRLCYCHPDTLAVTRYEEAATADALEDFLQATLAAFEAWLARQARHVAARDARLAELAFPYGGFRPHQRAMARRAYQALRDRERLLLEAPTGSGKTAAMLYPAVKALASAGYRRVFFLTSRTTGALAARDALQRMDVKADWLRHIVISARERTCFSPCEPASCPFGIGYYDRVRDAVIALLDRHAMTPAAIAEVARAHQVCPFELSLDAALWSDVVIGDYNYLFDPGVRLQRFAGERDAAVLVDEAHQLAPRVRDMLSLGLSRSEVRDAQAESPPASIARRIRAIDRQLLALARGRSGELAIDRPEALLRAVARFCESVFESGLPLEPWPATLALLFNATRWLRADPLDAPERWLFLLHAGAGGAHETRIERVCLDPGPWINDRLGEYGGHVRFSGTVSPMPLYQLMHGMPEAPAARAGNPFESGQLKVLLVDDVSTFYQARAASLARLVELVSVIASARGGHYLVAFPSFAYQRQFAMAWQAAHPAVPLVIQTPGMTETERDGFLAAFAPTAPDCLGLVVLGGVFGESVDFAGARLAGVICVGVGLPPPTLARAALAAHFDARGADGRAIAYQQPAMVKVLQMAGRLLRGPEDRGVLCLIDQRFTEPAYQQFFPSHWQPERTRAAGVAAKLANFWQESAGLPRLRASEQETSK
jgi:Rad3-related DNA helicase